MAEPLPFVPRGAGDRLSANDWNEAQSAVRQAVRCHRHGSDTPPLSAASVASDSSLRFHATAVESLNVAGVPAAELPIRRLLSEDGIMGTRLEDRLRVGESIKGDVRVQGALQVRGDLRITGDLMLTNGHWTAEPGSAGLEELTTLAPVSDRFREQRWEAGDLKVKVARRSTLLLLLRATHVYDASYEQKNGFGWDYCCASLIVRWEGRWYPVRTASKDVAALLPMRLEELRSKRRDNSVTLSESQLNSYRGPGGGSRSQAMVEIRTSGLEVGEDISLYGNPQAPDEGTRARDNTIRPRQIVRPLDVPAGDYLFRLVAMANGPWQLNVQVVTLPL